MKEELLRRESEHYEKKAAEAKGTHPALKNTSMPQIGNGATVPDVSAEFDDADDADSSEESDSEDSEDEEAELLRELERIKNEREEARLVKEAEEERIRAKEKEESILKGNPLTASRSDGSAAVKRRWDDDVVFRNQARGEGEGKNKKRFINDTIRNDFHRKFLGRYMH